MTLKIKVSPTKQEGELEASPKEVQTLLNVIVPKSVQELVGIIDDNVKSLRFKNQARILIQMNAYAKQHGLTLSPVSLKLLVPLLEGPSLEEDESLQKKWAALLLNAATKAVTIELP